MASKKFRTFCRIIDFVESVDPELAELLHGTCADISIGSTKGKPGITFLMPQDKSFRKKLTDLAYSDKTEDANKACDMLNALIIRDVLKNPSDWMNKRDDIPNSLLPPQHIEVENVTGKEVIFKSGAKAVLDERFKDATKKQNLAVWSLTGEIPVTNDKPAKLKYAIRRGKNGKAGGYEVTTDLSNNIRFKIAIAVENMYMFDQLEKSMGLDVVGGDHENAYKQKLPFPQRRRDVYLEHTLSLVNFVMNVRKDLKTLYDRVLPLISFQKIDFYNLIEPHRAKPEDSYLLPTVLINDWWTNRSGFNLQSIIEQIGQYITNGSSHSNAKIYTDRQGLIKVIDEKRREINKLSESRARNLPDSIVETYKQLNEANSIGDQSPIYPESLAAYYAKEPGLKVMQDELRYMTYLMFTQLEKSPNFDREQFGTIVNMIAEYMHAMTGDEREHRLQLMNKYTIKHLLMPTEKIQEIKIFVNSTHFLYIPLSQDEIMNYPIKEVIVKPDPTKLSGIWNIEKGLLSQHKRLASENTYENVKGLISSLRSQNPSSITPELKQSILELYAKIKD